VSETKRRVTRDEFFARLMLVEAEAQRDEALAVCRLVVDAAEGRVPWHLAEHAARRALEKEEA
jgi:hypothetical protein